MGRGKERSPVTCSNCRGKRTISHWCGGCHGSGIANGDTCRVCKGNKTVEKTCPTCHGQGVVKRFQPQSNKIPINANRIFL